MKNNEIEITLKDIFPRMLIVLFIYLLFSAISPIYCSYETIPSSAKIESSISQQLSCKADNISVAAVTNDNKLLNIRINSNTKLIKDNKNIIYFEKKVAIKPKFVLDIFWENTEKNIATEIHY